MTDKVTPNGKATFNADPRLDDGPLEDRGCTDILCCLLFIASWIAIVVVAAWGIKNGDPQLLTHPIDSSSNLCGYSAGFEDYPYIFYPKPAPGTFDYSTCVKTCPTDTSSKTLDCKVNNEVTTCTMDSDSESQLIYDMGTGSMSQTYIYKTFTFVDRFCLPSSKAVYKEATSLTSGIQSSGSDRITQWIADLKTCWTIILATAGIALVLGFIWMILMRYISGLLTWLSIVLFIAGVAVLGWVSYKKALSMEDDAKAKGQDPDSSDSSDYDTIQGLKILGYVCWGAAGLFCLIVCCIFKSIRLAIEIIKAAADYVQHTPTALLVPVFLFVVTSAFYTFWIIVALYLYSVGTPYSDHGGSPVANIHWDENTKRLLAFWVFELLWNNAFLIAVSQFTLGSSVCMWYFEQGTGQGPHSTVSRSFYRAFRYHLGSLAFGSLILAIVQFIQLVLRFVEHQVKKASGKNNKCLLYVVRCAECCVACFERFIKFLNRNAYIQIALTGKSFCGAAKDGFLLALSNPVRFGLVSSLGDIFIFVGKAFICILATLGGYLIITNVDYYSTKIYSPIFPSFAFLIVAYVIGEMFMSVYGMAANAILQCFCLDEELQKQKNCPPRHCPQNLKNFIDENRK